MIARNNCLEKHNGVFVLSMLVELDEKISLLITVLVLGLVFGSEYLLQGDLFTYGIITAIVSIAVIPHELAHRWSARRLGCYSRYVLSPQGLLLTLLTAIPFIPFKIIMAGFTLVVPTTHDPRVLKRINGIVSYMGPLTNILIASISLVSLVFLVKSGYIDPLVISILYISTRLNSWIAIFNLLPVPPLDGIKVLTWKPLLWITMMLLSIGLFLISLIGI